MLVRATYRSARRVWYDESSKHVPHVNIPFVHHRRIITRMTLPGVIYLITRHHWLKCAYEVVQSVRHTALLFAN